MARCATGNARHFSNTDPILELHKKLPRGLRQIVGVRIQIEILVGRADIKNRKRIQLVAQQRLNVEAAVEIVILRDQAQEQFARELVIDARAQDITAEDLSAIGIIQLRIRILRLDDEPLHRLDRRPHLKIVSSAQNRIVQVARNKTSVLPIESHRYRIAEIAVDVDLETANSLKNFLVKALRAKHRTDENIGLPLQLEIDGGPNPIVFAHVGIIPKPAGVHARIETIDQFRVRIKKIPRPKDGLAIIIAGHEPIIRSKRRTGGPIVKIETPMPGVTFKACVDRVAAKRFAVKRRGVFAAIEMALDS